MLKANTKAAKSDTHITNVCGCGQKQWPCEVV